MVQLSEYSIDSSQQTLVVESLINEADVAQYVDAWSTLVDESDLEFPFMLPEWLQAASQHKNASLQALALTQSRQLVSLWPLCLQGKIWGRRRLFFMGEGPADFQMLLGDSPSALREGLDCLVAQSNWDVLDLCPLSQEKTERYAAAWEGHPDVWMIQDEVTTALSVDLSGDWQSAVERRVRNTVAQKTRRLNQRIGIVSDVQAESEAEVRENLTILFALHIKRWAPTATPSQFAETGGQRAFEELVMAWWQAGILDLRALKVNEQVIAVQVNAVTDSTYYSYVAAYDPEFNKYSPGTVLLWRLMESAAEQNLSRFEFLRGGEAYKRDWGHADHRRVMRLRVYRNQPGLKAWLGCLAICGRLYSAFLRRVIHLFPRSKVSPDRRS